MEALEDATAEVGGDLANLPRLEGVAGQRLLAEHVLTGAQRGYVPLSVLGVDQGVVDEIDIGVLDQVQVRVVDPPDTACLGEGRGPLRIPCRDGDHLVSQQPSRLKDAGVSNARRPEDSYPHTATATPELAAVTTASSTRSVRSPSAKVAGAGSRSSPATASRKARA